MNNKNDKNHTPDSQRQSTDIPKFDLADDIMADQRKTIASKRKSPSRKLQQPQENGHAKQSHFEEENAVTLCEEDRLIRELVAQDIERLCRGENPDN